MSERGLQVSPLASRAQDSTVETHTWAVVLAGGKGTRLSGLTRHVYGEDRPKQYAALTGGKSLLRQTLDRVGVLIPPDRTVVVTMVGQGSYLAAELRHESPSLHVLDQPRDRGTAAAVLLATHWILAQDPEARLVMLPSDHFVADDTIFMGHVAEVLNGLELQPERIVLLGAKPSEPEPDYGWIEPGEALPGSRRAGRECLPSLHARLARLPTFFGTEHERWALRQAYELAPQASFSRAVLERSPRKLAVMQLSGVVWRDLGTPDRVIKTLDELGIHPDWLAALRVAV